MKALMLGLVAFTGFVLAPPSITAGRESPERGARSPEPTDGRTVWLQDCAFCHGAQADGTARAPSLEGTGAAYTYYMVSSGRMPIERPDEDVTPGPSSYPPEMVEELARYVASLVGGPGIPPARPERGDLALGGRLFRINCAACHGATGIGTALPSGVEAPHLRDSGPREIAAVLVVGPGNMPRFSPPLSAHEIDSIARYVLELRAPASPGGHPLGFVGPLAEGAVALFVGLAGLVLAARWIGKRREP